jgi:hypothetical protein
MLIEAQVGPVVSSDGSETNLRQGKDGSLIVSDGHGRFYELASRGGIYTGMTAVAGTTVVAANNTPVAAGAASILSLYNPLSSGYYLELLKTFLMLISGTPAAGAFVYNMALNQNITATQNNGNAAGATPQQTFAPGASGVGRVFTQTALTGSGAQMLLRPLGIAPFAGAIAATSTGLIVTDVCDGDIVLPPGGLLSIASPGTGTAQIAAACFVWAENKQPG